MSIYLNTNKPLKNYSHLYRSKYFVDKSLIIEELNEVILTSDRYVCITRPRRFGKSSVIDMLGAYYSKGLDSSSIFDNLKISESESYKEHLKEKTGKGSADFTFHPRRKNDTAFIVELKKDENVDVAINQIKNKEYIEKFKKENEDKKVLAVAICYNSKDKEHSCKIEEI